MKRLSLYRLAAGSGLCAAVIAGLLLFLDRTYPPDLSRYLDISRVVTDRDGQTLRAYLSGDQAMRLPVTVSDVDPGYIEMLIAYEDKRFYRHSGVDFLALARAAGQALVSGRVVSGASTLTMQAARLLEPRSRTLGAKAIEMARAWQLEWRYSKDQILSIYLTLAPFGGNVEGVRAGSLAVLGRPPRDLTPTEAALLVALPQSPSRLRPSRHPKAARAARDKVLRGIAGRIGLEDGLLVRLVAEDIPRVKPVTPFWAPHLADRLIREYPGMQVIETTVDGHLQKNIELMARRAAGDLGPSVSIAILITHNRTREVLGYVGSADFKDDRRDGQVDMVTAVRSPGSTLKPLIYGLAFERGIAHPATLVNDAPRRFGAYAPRNFQGRYHGEVSLAEALRKSLNVPAVVLLDRLGPVGFVERLRRAGIGLHLPGDSRPGLPVALGGVGTTLGDLVALYAAIADDGIVRPLVLSARAAVEPHDREPLLGPRTRAQLRHILKRVRRPGQAAARQSRRIAFKTGTSYGFRDAWAIGFDEDYTVGVWVGRPDGTPNPGHFGSNTAAPLLFDLFGALPEGQGGGDPLVADLSFDAARLPPALKYIDRPLARRTGKTRPGPRILFPVSGAQIALGQGGRGIPLEAEGGSRPYRWIVNDKPYLLGARQRRPRLIPDGPGFTEITLIDAAGRRARSSVRFIEAVAAQ